MSANICRCGKLFAHPRASTAQPNRRCTEFVMSRLDEALKTNGGI